jgi:hypothetical protein
MNEPSYDNLTTFKVLIDFGASEPAIAGFSEAVGLASGEQDEKTITLRNGLMSASDLDQWLDDTGFSTPTAVRTVTMHVRDASGRMAQRYTLTGTKLQGYTGEESVQDEGFMLLEEFILSYESITSN